MGFGFVGMGLGVTVGLVVMGVFFCLNIGWYGSWLVWVLILFTCWFVCLLSQSYHQSLSLYHGVGWYESWSFHNIDW